MHVGAALGCGKQLGVVTELTGIVPARACDATLAGHTWGPDQRITRKEVGYHWRCRHRRRDCRGRRRELARNLADPANWRHRIARRAARRNRADQNPLG